MGVFFPSPGDVVDFAGQRVEITEVGNIKLNELFVIVHMFISLMQLRLDLSAFVRIRARQDNF